MSNLQVGKIRSTSYFKTLTALSGGRNRRIKCDETKPVCLKCSQSRRDCQGYTDPFQYHSAVDVSAVSTSSLPLLDQGLFADHIFYPATKEDEDGLLQEKRSFWHFITHASVQIPSVLDLRVWTEIIPMLSTTFPAIRYAVLALSAQHEITLYSSSIDNNDNNWKSSKSLDALRIFSYNQYGKAIRRLNMILIDAVQEYDVLLETLFACLLLIVCEVLQGSDVAAQYHLDGAIRLICMPSVAKSQLILADSNISNWRAIKELSLIFQQLDLQAAAFSGPRVPICPGDVDSITRDPLFNLHDAQSEKAKNGRTIEELRQNLLSMQAKVSRFIDSRTVIKCKYRSQLKQTQRQEDEFNAIKKVQETLLEQLEHWKTDFDPISPESTEGLNPNKQYATIVMLLSYLTSYVLLSTSLSSDEMAYDSHSATFAHIIELSEICLQQKEQQRQFGSLTIFSSFSFKIDVQVIHPLYITALKCRDYTMRRRAVRLLSMCGREGVWDGRMMASIARSVIACEEEFATRSYSEDENSMISIPERGRIHGVGIVDMDREKGEVNMVCSRKMGMMTVNVDNQVIWERVVLYAKF